jgi:hypothetical protein
MQKESMAGDVCRFSELASSALNLSSSSLLQVLSAPPGEVVATL